MSSSRCPAPAQFPARMPIPERTPQLLSVGNDPVLLSYREQVLCWAGFGVATTQFKEWNPNALGGAPQVCIVCHSLSLAERAAVVETVRHRWSKTRILAVAAGNISRAEAALFDCIVENLDGPAALINKVRDCLPGASATPESSLTPATRK